MLRVHPGFLTTTQCGCLWGLANEPAHISSLTLFTSMFTSFQAYLSSSFLLLLLYFCYSHWSAEHLKYVGSCTASVCAVRVCTTQTMQTCSHKHHAVVFSIHQKLPKESFKGFSAFVQVAHLTVSWLKLRESIFLSWLELVPPVSWIKPKLLTSKTNMQLYVLEYVCSNCLIFNVNKCIFTVYCIL